MLCFVLYHSKKSQAHIVVFKPTLEYKKDGNIQTKGNVDAELVLHTMIHYSNYDKAIIVSGDGDFHCLIEYLVEKGKLANVIIPNPNKYSALLRKFRKHFVYLYMLQRKLGKKK